MAKVHTLRLRIPSATDSRAGDEAALEALNGSLTGLGTGWSSDMSLGDSIDGVTTDTIGGELRVTQVYLKDKGLTGNINVSQIGNLKEMTQINLFYNNLTGQIPSEINGCTKLKYMYLNGGGNYDTDDPHEIAAGGDDVHPAKGPPANNNDFSGAFPDISGLIDLRWINCSYTSVTSIHSSVWGRSSLEGLYFHGSESMESTQLPSTIGNLTNLTHWAMGIEGQTNKGWLNGPIPSEIGQMTSMKFFRFDKQAFSGAFPDLSSLTNMEAWNTILSDFDQQTIPTYLLDGTLPNLRTLNVGFPSAGTGFTGAVPEVDSSMDIGSFLTYGNPLTSLPASFWESNQDLILTEFTNNSLTTLGKTDLRNDLTGFYAIRNMIWNNCDIEGEPIPIIDFTDAGQTISRFYMEGNRYVFSDFLHIYSGETKPIFELWADHVDASNNLGVGDFTYSSQQSFGSQSNYDSGTSTIDFSSIVTHTDNVYQWKRNGSNISGSTATLDVSGFNGGDEIDLVVTNTTFDAIVSGSSLTSGLTLNSVTITL